MKAMMCQQYGPPEQLVLMEVPDPAAEPGEVVIDVAACGVNFPDTLIIRGQYQSRPALPFAPGSDIAGVVSSVGDGVNGFVTGDAVIALLPYGGFAERVVAPVPAVVPKPPTMSFVEAAAFSMTYGTALHALQDRAALQPGETLLVMGAAGGVGLAAVEVGVLLGARVIAAASTPEKLALCSAYGAEAGINYRQESLKERTKDLTEGRGADVVFDPVGGPFAEQALRATGVGGRFLVIGFAAGEIPRIPLNLPLLKENEIVGVFWGAFARRNPQANAANFDQLAAWHAAGRLKPYIHTVYSLAESPRALRALMDRTVLGKGVVSLR